MTSTQAPAPAPNAAISTIITDDQHDEIWKHLMEDVIRYKIGQDLCNLLQKNGVTDVLELMTEFASNEEDVAKWNYKREAGPDKGTKYNISKKNIADILALQDYIYNAAAKLLLPTPAQMTFTQFMSLNRQDFAIMRTDPRYKKNRTVTFNATDPTLTNTTTNTGAGSGGTGGGASNAGPGGGSFNNFSAAQLFRKSIKRDPSHFPELKHDNGYDSWKRGTQVNAKVQDVAEILDSSYVPDATDEEVFNLKQGYMYSIFEKNLLTNKGKAIVRKYQKEGNAQLVFKELDEHYTKSINAQANSTELNHYIITTRIDDNKWNGTTYDYVMHWQEQVRLYHSLIPDASRYSDKMLLDLLHNAVSGHPELRTTYQLAQQSALVAGSPISYDDYCTLLLGACTNYDNSIKKKGARATKEQRNIYLSETDDSVSGITGDTGIEIYNIDTNPGIIEANFVRRGSSMTKQQWIRLDEKSQTIWDQLTPDAKSIILERPPPKPTGQLPSTSPRNTAYLKKQGERRRINLSELSELLEAQEDDDDGNAGQDDHDDISGNQLTAFLSEKTDKLHPAHLQRLMSSKQPPQPAKPTHIPNKKDIKVKTLEYMGHEYSINLVNLQYSVSNYVRTKGKALIDRGANGGVAGSDVTVVNRLLARKVDITGVEQHQIKDIYLGTVAGMTNTSKGPVIVFLHQQALLCKGSSILSSVQMEAAGCTVNDRSSKLDKQGQRIVKDGYIFPLSFENGLPRMRMRPVTDEELADSSIPHCHLTDDVDWDPTIFDNDGTIESFEEHVGYNDPLFDEFGNYRKTVIINSALLTDGVLNTHPFLEDYIITSDDINLEVFARESEPSSESSPDDETGNEHPAGHKPNDSAPNDEHNGARVLDDSRIDFEALRPNFGWQPTEIVKRTFDCTTQHGRLPMGDKFQKHYRSPHPALNVHRRDEDVATDTVYSDTPAIDDGGTVAQFYCGRESLVCDIYGMKTDSQFVNTLQDNIRKRGAMNRLLSDRAQVEINGRVKDFLRLYCIGDWQSEPLQDHQKPSERRYQVVKTMANTIMSRTGSPAYTWLLALLYVCFILNHSASAHLNYQAPLSVMTGTTIDSSPLLLFRWWELVEYKIDETDFPSNSPGAIGHFVGFSENVGHRMTFKILTLDTLKVIHRANVRSAETDDTFNWKAIAALDGEDIPEVIKSIRDRLVPASKEGTTRSKTNADGQRKETSSKDIKEPQSPTIPIEDLIGRTFLLNENTDGEKHRARIVEAIDDQDEQNKQHPEHVKFRCSVNDEQYEEIISYNELMDYIEGQEQDDRVWKFRRIVSHEGPLTKRHPDWRGSNYNVMIEWENGEVTREPLRNIAADDPVTCAIYARENDLLDLPGWKRFKTIAKRQKKMFRMANQAKLRSFRTAPKYMYGFEVPRDWNHAIKLDARNGNNKWRKSTELEFEQLEEYDTFIDIGFSKTPDGYKKIKVHLVYAVKHDGRHKARCVADGHLTDVPVDSVYSGVVSLRGIRMLIFLAELNGLETWGTDIGNAYLEATTSERLVITAGPEFGDLEGHTLIIFKALYGLRTSGLRWHLRFSAVLKKEGFMPCKMEPDLWLRATDDGRYEYVGVYVDDLAFSMKDPQSFTDLLVREYQFKLKGTGPIEFHLGCDFVRDKDGVLAMQPKKYINRMVDSYVRMFGEKPNRRVKSPLEENDHPEIDNSDFLDEDGIAKYQSLVGSMQWAISLGRIDIATACMTLSSFRACPRIGHLERAKRVVAYLSNMPDAMIRFRTKLPDMSDLPGFEYNWDQSIYGDVREELPNDAPTPLGNPVLFTHYVDANLYHDLLTGRSVTGILHMANQTPIDWFSKKQGKVETATYGSEFMAARTCVEQIIDIRLTFRYLGVPVHDKSYLFGDNEAVVNSAARIDSKLHKRHNALSYHRVREAIASRMMDFYHIPGKDNPADILSKHWAYGKVWDLLQPLMFWQGDTASIEDYKNKKRAKKLEDDKATVSTAPSTIKMDRS